MFTPAKRHDIAVIERVHTSTDLKWKKKTWKTYELIKATKVSKGKIVDYTTGCGSIGAIHDSHRVFIIADQDKQAAAKELFGKVDSFDSIDAVKAAILDRVEALS
jgi:hypothetical protein